MPLETQLNVSPYFDDFNEDKEFYRILFRPSVAVQTRELNQLQSIMQNQIERFGNHVFKNGTIISGVNFEYIPVYPYIKINDTNSDGQPVDLVSYSQYYLKNSSNLVSKVVNYKTGLESRDPDLNTLYVRYLNSGSSNSAQGYANNETLTVYDVNNPVFSVTVYNGATGFANTDTVVFLSAITLANISGSFATNEVITQSTTGAKAQILEVNTTAIAATTTLKIKPLTVHLTNNSVNSTAWSFSTGYNILGNTSSATANVASIVGSGAVGIPLTDSQGIVESIEVTAGGNGYIVVPHTTIKTANTTGPVDTLSLVSLNYLAQITVANSSFTAPVGNGYAFAVTDGIVYQKGTFVKVDPQVIVVDKYSNSPNALSVGFTTDETIVESTADTSLLDNATGTINYTAPGANRMKLTANLVVMSTANAQANLSFLPLVEFSEGTPYKENRVTVYNTLAREFERRTKESAGDFVLDRFDVGTKEKETANGLPNSTYLTATVDPGTAYISGARIETFNNTQLDLRKGTDTKNLSSQIVTANYGQYILVKELMGSFNVVSGASVSLRDTARGSVSNTSITTIAGAGNEIGTARIRSIVYNSGVVGTSTAVFEVYLFDITMNAGKNFRDIKSIYYDGTIDGVADLVLELDATTSTNVAVLKQGTDKSIVFNTGIGALKTVNNTSYVFKTTNESLTINAAGCVAITLSGADNTFPYTALSTLSASQAGEIQIIPTANLQAAANIAGGVTATNNYIVGTSTTFASTLRAGDYIKVANTVANEIFQVSSIANNTYLVVTANATTMNAISANAMLFFPQYMPLNFTSRTDRPITVSSGSTTLTANLNVALTSANTVAATFNVRKTSTTGQVTRSVYRDAYVKLDLSNNATSNTGPWCLGVPDAFRLKNVYLGSTPSATDVTKHFYIDSGQNDGYYGHSLLRQVFDKARRTSLNLTTSDVLLVRFDVFQHSAAGGFSTVSSFTINDSNTLSNSSSSIHTVELPEYFDAADTWYPLRDCIDFRPVISNTAVVTNTYSSATTNPANTVGFSGALNFPVPDSSFQFDSQQYMGRKAIVTVDKNGSFKVTEGTPGTISLEEPLPPAESMLLSKIYIPPYPSIGVVSSNSMITFANKNIGNASGRKSKMATAYTVKTKWNDAATNAPAANQPRQYTMKDLVSLENRIKALENQSLFNALETQINRLNIPSSLDATVDRFKNGFFVDGFTDYLKADTANKEYAASIDLERRELHPLETQLNMQMVFDRTDSTTNNALVANSVLMLPYTEYTLVSQPFATSYVTGDGNRGQFIGEMVLNPSAFPIEATLQQTVDIVLDAGQDPAHA